MTLPGTRYRGDTAPALLSTRSGALRMSRLLAPVLERIRRLLVYVTLAVLAVTAYSFTRPRKFQATVMVSTVGGTSKLANLSASLPAVLMAAASASGLQATPALLVRLASSRNVLVHVGRSRVPGRSDSTVADLLRHHRVPASKDDEVFKAVRRIANASIDRETGLVSLTVIHSDSALARFVTDTLMGTISDAFQTAVHSQATQTRAALSGRLDSAAAQLSQAEQAVQSFREGNRIVQPYSAAAIEQERVQRELMVAQTVYDQARTESEAAKARELTEDPTVVVVDPIPRELVPVPRGTVAKGLTAGIAVALVYVIFVVLIDLARGGAMTADEDRARIRDAARSLPVLRRWVA